MERYLSPEMKARLEEEQKLEEERRLAALQDNWRERGLDQMMGGVLEIRKEDELKKVDRKKTKLKKDKGFAKTLI